ncbi:hypothetical protein K402DRAFT_406779 [Aulographum hederae CBS 113979]|uniref:Uncharacterized protein n=1 Tax=Aulographum hederae CBS 113979 TaxID=1176131 RepID=A0A6G1GS09_9PEZI|nr:hypothetical protein K402DRAFT_406779 [Aulographum hederae CBS 113979]
MKPPRLTLTLTPKARALPTKSCSNLALLPPQHLSVGETSYSDGEIRARGVLKGGVEVRGLEFPWFEGQGLAGAGKVAGAGRGWVKERYGWMSGRGGDDDDGADTASSPPSPSLWFDITRVPGTLAGMQIRTPGVEGGRVRDARISGPAPVGRIIMRVCHMASLCHWISTREVRGQGGDREEK